MGSLTLTVVPARESELGTLRTAVRNHLLRSAARGPGRGAGVLAERMLEQVQQFDGDRDGKIDKTEVPARFHGVFARLDGNGDGVIDAQELAALKKELGG
jgi:hypothetical protein